MRSVYWFLIAIIIYICAVNIAAGVMQYALQNPQAALQTQDSGTAVHAQVSDSSSVTVIRNRWYGQITENSPTTSTLTMFGFISLPLQTNGLDFTPIHIAF